MSQPAISNEAASYLKRRDRRIYLTSSNLLLLAFSTAFFARVLAGLGIPSSINFVHFGVIPIACGLILSKARFRDIHQISLVKGILFSCIALLGVITASAFLNGAGSVNAILSFILLTEPFILLLAMISLSMGPSLLERFRRQWLRCSLVNLLFALCQSLVLRVDRQNADLVKGVFVGQGSGHVVGASVSMTFAIYYFATATDKPLWIRICVFLAVFFHIIKSDAKQVLAVFLAALLVLIFLSIKSVKRFVQYLAIAVGFIGLVIVLANTVFSALLIWADLETQQEGLALKLSGVSIIPTYFHSPLNWILGLGPGHTVGRLGGWMLWEYKDLLEPLGATTSRASVAVWRATRDSWLGDKSSWFSPLFGWAGIWGDLGFLGLGVYLSFWWLIWNKLCRTLLTKFFVLTILIYGLILSQIEEPGYMLYMVGIIALCWHQHRQPQGLAHAVSSPSQVEH